MSATEELRRDLEELERPTWRRLQVRDEPPLARLYATAALHRLLPARVAVPLVERAAGAAWRLSPGRRREGRALARAVLGPGAAPADLEDFGRRELAERWAIGELFWRPWRARATPVEGLERLRAARERGRGVILVSAHLGPSGSLVHALAARGVRLYISRFRKVRDDPVRFGAQARWSRANLRWTEAAGCRWVGRGESYPVFRALLERGEVCWLFFDIPGTVETDLGGRRVGLAGGIARLARETGAPVVPGFALRDGHRAVCWLEEPLDPAAFPDAAALHARLGRVVGDVLFAHPEQGARQIQLLGAGEGDPH